MRPLRQFLPDRCYLITARCFEERFLLAPGEGKAVSNIVATALAQAACKFQLELFAYVAMSNHVHVIVRAPHGGLPEAMQLFLSQVARRINVLRGRRGPVFADRYHHQAICDERALQTAVRYVLLNPVRAGVSSCAGSWNGLSSFQDTCNGIVTVCTRHVTGDGVGWRTARFTREEWIRLKKTEDPIAGEERFLLACQPIAFSTNAQRTLFVESVTREVRTSRTRPPVHFFEAPKRPARSPAPSCIASSTAGRRHFIAERRAFERAYRLASSRFRRGQVGTFPPGCCLPWPHLNRLTSCSDTFPVETASPVKTAHELPQNKPNRAFL